MDLIERIDEPQGSPSFAGGNSSRLLARAWSRVALLVALVFSLLLPSLEARAEHLSDLAEVVGARENQLVGYGVVTGLDGTGDDFRSRVAEQTLRSLLRRLGVQVDESALRFRNVAAVIVTANIPPFARTGSKIDVTVSSIGNARSLMGGVLIQSPLRGADRVTYAVAQGPIAVGGYGARGRSGSSVQVNVTNTGRIPGGALVEREIPTNLTGVHPEDKKQNEGKTGKEKGKSEPEEKPEPALTYALRIPDFVTAQRIATAINDALGDSMAEAVDGGAVKVKLPDEFKENPVPLLARLAEIEVTPHMPARVVVSERTGTIVAGGDVRLSPVAVAQGGLSISIFEQYNVSQPNPFADSGQTVVRPQSDVAGSEREVPLRYIEGGATLKDVASVLGAMGVTPRELASILQALKTAGALRAEVIVQ
jgi:flagellar P-ring protein precursor FlgI